MLDCPTGLDTHCKELPECPLTPGSRLTCKLCRCRFPVPPVGSTCFFAFGPNSDFLLRRLYASDAILVARPVLSERLATYLFYFQMSGL